ncbi:MAG: SseB family protein [Canibacter sp.]
MDITPDYENTSVREALDALQQTPDYDHLVSFLNSLREGYLVVDVTGKKKTRIRTIRSTKGQLVLPIFTSLDELRAAAAKAGAKGAVMPAREALALIRTDRFVAAEFNPASSKQVMLRKYVELAAGEDEITQSTLEEMRA